MKLTNYMLKPRHVIVDVEGASFTVKHIRYWPDNRMTIIAEDGREIERNRYMESEVRYIVLDPEPVKPFSPPHDVIDATEALLDMATRLHHNSASDETFTECQMCGQWEEHTVTCPIPLLQKWMKS